MYKKALLVTALCASSIGLTGCSSMWSAVSVFSADMAEATNFSFLRGKSEKSDISFAQNDIDSESGVYKTEVGEYIPEAPTEADFNTDSYAANIDTSQHACPDGTYLTEDNSCMSFDTDSYDFASLDMSNEEQFIDTSQHECPEDTYLNAENACMYFETETFDFEDDNSSIDMVVDTSPHPCPEGTYLTEDNACMYLDNEMTDLAQTTDTVTTETSVIPAVSSVMPAAPSMVPAVSPVSSVMPAASSVAPAVLVVPAAAPAVSVTPLNSYPANLSVECPKGFTPTGDNSCMYLGAEVQN